MRAGLSSRPAHWTYCWPGWRDPFSARYIIYMYNIGRNRSIFFIGWISGIGFSAISRISGEGRTLNMIFLRIPVQVWSNIKPKIRRLAIYDEPRCWYLISVVNTWKLILKVFLLLEGWACSYDPSSPPPHHLTCKDNPCPTGQEHYIIFSNRDSSAISMFASKTNYSMSNK